ncbi:hypothetical protein SynMEDNS5_01853 [Synechococcus sp. MEDNS5]|nr:hypothetical protein SynMEDNS5_01853 [Synechococcus sp. MEDNS5]
MIPFGQWFKRKALLFHLFNLCSSTSADKNRKFSQTRPAQTVQREQTEPKKYFSSS